jgi:nitrogen fixation protein NifX
MNDNQSSEDRLFWRLFALAQLLPTLDAPALVTWLSEGGERMLDLQQISSLSLDRLRQHFPGDANVVTLNQWQQIVACLQGELPTHLTPQPQRQRDAQLKVAFASKDGLNVNGHFGQSRFFFIYAFDEAGAYLQAMRRYPGDSEQEESNELRAKMIDDCHLLFCEAIGGPAAARVIRHNIHPVKVNAEVTIASQLMALHNMLDEQLPPWLAKQLGKNSPLTSHVF